MTHQFIFARISVTLVIIELGCLALLYGYISSRCFFANFTAPWFCESVFGFLLGFTLLHDYNQFFSRNVVADSIRHNPGLDTLQSAKQRHLLDTIDKLRNCGLDSELSLPQLVVCGD